MLTSFKKIIEFTPPFLKMIGHILKIVLLFFLPYHVLCQNLVKNPSFEHSKLCAIEESEFASNVKHWSTPTKGTTDLFNTCSTGDSSIPENFAGHQDVLFGEKYAGCYLYSDDDYREYIQGHFKSPLKKGKKYIVSFYVSLGDKSKYALRNIEFLLTKSMILNSIWSELSQSELDYLDIDYLTVNRTNNENFLNNKGDWIMVSNEIIAKGGESFITIGNFQKNSKTKKRKIKGVNKSAHNISYYYIDNVSVKLNDTPIEMVAKSAVQPNKKDTLDNNIGKIKLNESYIFKNVRFNYNNTQLSEAAKNELKMVYDFLNLNADTKIIITGHTDNTGSKLYNQTLSEKRAESVASYIINLGIQKERITHLGRGNSQPLSDNNTEEGKSRNRRVEFKVIK